MSWPDEEEITRILAAILIQTRRPPARSIFVFPVLDRFGIRCQEAEELLLYLQAEGLLDVHNARGGLVTSTHKGANRVNASRLEERQRTRNEFLRIVYEAADGSSRRSVENILDLAVSAGLDRDEANEAWNWLGQRDLLVSYLGGDAVRLTEEGVAAVEASLRSEQGAMASPSSPAVTVFGNVHGNFQIGRQNTAIFNQAVGASVGEILEVLGHLRTELNALQLEAREDALAHVHDIEVEVKAERPSRSRLRAFIAALRETADAGSVIAGFGEKVLPLIEKLRPLVDSLLAAAQS